MSNKDKELSIRVIELVGGESNVNDVYHCATRLRFTLKDHTKANEQALKNIAGVITVVKSGGQFQVVIGNNVSKVYEGIMEHTNLQDGGSKTDTKENAEKTGIFGKTVDLISSVFSPLLSALAGAGLLKGLVVLSVALGWLDDTSGTYLILNAASSSVFTFLPIFLAVTAARKFKANMNVSLAIAGALVFPTISAAFNSGQTYDFLGIPIVLVMYTSTVFPILLAVWVQSHIEKWFNSIIHQSIRNILVPMLSLLIVVPLTILAFGPIGNSVSQGLASGFTSLMQFSPMLAGAVTGGFWQVIVIFGLHWAFLPITLNNLATIGYDLMRPMLTAAVLAQAGALLAVMLKTRNSQLKTLSGSATITAIFGITEPGIYGVTLRLKKPFIYACISAAIGGAIIGVGGGRAVAYSLPSLLAFPTYVTTGFASVVIGVSVSFVLAFLLTLLLGFKDLEATVEEPQIETSGQEKQAIEPSESRLNKEIIVSPLKGSVQLLEDLPDPAFSSGAMGQGLVIEPTVGILVSPINGVVTTVFPTGHALGLTTDSGMEILIHIGVNTVKLKGQFFEKKVKEGDRVSCGQLLVEFDAEQIRTAGYITATSVIVTNSANYLDVLKTTEQEVKQGDYLMSAVV
ncbi:PTS system beta-glucoside-specific transporter subunits IIABC [Paenibacillus sp. FSL R5-192]|uniref:beta-glucoside-specific PTS transporter subunit IIABC n=1 Tax=Paenibacillus sp. FSL R5-192 TaxID=1226754 RepID=UPI0003E21A83|nr:beta-glucoside-specific PTS transporter subunit IIABC [Paenibacillus sp. FSL R5-192]ETT36071.1 PTS system beta-glucoside-specific transporter subunits IIABC [Paenibacillus sp. FSL R5-192]